ncbi:MAG TPA: transglycosylase SLT domain-containing protein [bacterium]|nr:transglycosylase SLT domain-containing protein [bacterium]HQG46847.1 transglycosylase SLT domain-containing protein [bacterium]HQI47763.1 transglycosylase SLT domain-containing protein [bacterium]HQJ63193.1 transglycosylase SLT domain-containing protein [bacterium]
MPTKRDKVANYLRTALWILSVLALIIIVVSGFKYTYNQRYIRKIAELEQVIKGMRSTMSVESVRQYNIQRIIAIISQYNRTMPTHLKYEIAKEITDACANYSSLDPDFLCALITRETNGTWNPEYISDYGAMGLMAITPTIGSFVARSEHLNWITPDEVLLNPVYNIRIGARYLSALIDAYDLDGALVARSVGERRAAMWVKSGRSNALLPRDTITFLADMLQQYDQMKALKI